ncbi:doublecortin domain-containing protein 2C [Rhea pennata]|uniref:doublecortin domain-containing protein 2C n=1 Tax=Rhea pennata TaxID=8795 RepID=UPI002E275FB2
MVASPAPPPGCSRADLAPARTVLVYLNGDPFYPGKKFVVNRRHVPTFEALLAQLSEAVAAPYGVRALYTPRQGHRLRDLGDIEQGGRYVAAGLEKFKKLDYIEIGIKKQQGKRKEVMIKPVVHSSIRVPSRWQCMSNKPRNINVFTNGEMIKPPIKFIIPKFTLKNWNCVLALINEKVFLRSGGVHRLYTLDGHAVHSSDGLEDNHFYVAVGRENFKPLPYWRSPRVPSEVRCLYGESRASSRRSKKKKARSEKPRARRSSSRPPGKPVENAKIKDEKANSGINGKSKKASPERTSDPALATAPSIFKADKPREEVEGAEEVQDDKNVQVEMPIDQIPAEIVQEEEIPAPTSDTVNEVEADALTSEDTPEKEEKKAWSMKSMFDLLRRKPDNTADSMDNEGQTEKPEEEPEEEDNS